MPDAFPPYSYVPGGPFPHPTRDPGGHLRGRTHEPVDPVEGDAWQGSPMYLRGVELFNAGYYWEAHEAWELLWNAEGRKGPKADVLRALIKVAAAGVKVREGQPHGVVTHAQRAADLFRTVREASGPFVLGLDLAELTAVAGAVAADPPVDPSPRGTPVCVVFGFRIEPSQRS